MIRGSQMRGGIWLGKAGVAADTVSLLAERQGFVAGTCAPAIRLSRSHGDDELRQRFVSLQGTGSHPNLSPRTPAA